MKKLTRRVTCSVCYKLRIVTFYPKGKAERQECLAELALPYVCTDHPVTSKK